MEKDSTFTDGSEERLAREFSKPFGGRVYVAELGRTPERNLEEALRAVAGFLTALSDSG